MVRADLAGPGPVRRARGLKAFLEFVKTVIKQYVMGFFGKQRALFRVERRPASIGVAGQDVLC